MEIAMGVPIWLRVGDASGIALEEKKPVGPVWLMAEGSSSLGLALAKAVLSHGHRVALATSNTAAVRHLADANRDTAIVVAFNPTKPDDIARIMNETKDRFGSLDVLVNTAGVGYVSAAEAGDVEDIGGNIAIDISSPAVT
jgi:NAD(P)-dependent dehydrogenase (short-subunit alcohol dehydrogenase family)